MWWRFPHYPTAYDDDFEDQPTQGWFFQWVLGAVLPVAILTYGVVVLISRHAGMGREGQLVVHGVNAVAYGCSAISLGIFLHFHYFWGNVYNQVWFAVLGKIAVGCGFIVGLGILIVRVGLLGIN